MFLQNRLLWSMLENIMSQHLNKNKLENVWILLISDACTTYNHVWEKIMKIVYWTSNQAHEIDCKMEQ